MIINPNFILGGPKLYSCMFRGAPNEELTLKNSEGVLLSIYPKIGADATSATSPSYDIPEGIWYITGSISGYTRTVEINQSGTYDIWPDGATIYYWHGYKPIGNWATIDTVPSTSTYHNSPVAPTPSESTNSIHFHSGWNYPRGGTAYLPKTTIKGSTMTLLCSGATNNNYLALNLCPGFSWAYTPGAVQNISSGATTVNMNIASVSGGSYHPAISMNTKNDAYDQRPSEITVHALYSV